MEGGQRRPAREDRQAGDTAGEAGVPYTPEPPRTGTPKKRRRRRRPPFWPRLSRVEPPRSTHAAAEYRPPVSEEDWHNFLFNFGERRPALGPRAPRKPFSEIRLPVPDRRGLTNPVDAVQLVFIMKQWLSSTVLGVELSLGLLLIPGCGASYHAKQVRTAQDAKRLTVGVVQREIRKGMSGAGVLEVLGSPNVVSTDESGREVWVYDRFATDVVASESGWSVFGVGGGFGRSGAGGGGLGLGARAGAASKSQRTLTIIIKFDESKRVRDFAYHASRF